jgi:putative methionine-R-sulfoxide reductase with GAF domain
VSKFDLRDISERLAGSSDTEAVVFEFIGYLQSVQPDWRASLAFYEVSQDALVNVYQREGARLVRRDLTVPVGQLPARLVRKFFHPSAFFNHAGTGSMLSQWLRASPSYEPDLIESPMLRPLVAIPNWQSCVCLPLADHEDMLAMLVIASERKKAFGGKAIADLVPVKSIAALALAQHLHRAGSGAVGEVDVASARAAAGEFQDRIRRLNEQTLALEEDNRTKEETLAALRRELGQLDANSSQYRQELERVKGTLLALEEQSAAATVHLSAAYTELNVAQTRLEQLERTLSFLKDVFQALSQEHDPHGFSRTMVAWLCEQFAVERCSLMLIDSSGETLKIAAQSGIDPALAGRVKVRIGQGIAGWVAHNRRPLFVRVQDEVPAMPRTVKETYNSESFICVPLIHGNRLLGVLNLSNKREGEPFEEIDLDRAVMAGSVLAMALSGHETARRAAAWT